MFKGGSTRLEHIESLIVVRGLDQPPRSMLIRHVCVNDGDELRP